MSAFPRISQPWAGFLYVSILTCSLPFLARRGYASHHEEESYESFTSRYVTFFESVQDLFELQRGLNNCFAYDLVPSPEIVEAALRASRRVNDYSTAVRIFEGVKEKVENEKQYQQYVEALKPVRDELGESPPPLDPFNGARRASLPSVSP